MTDKNHRTSFFACHLAHLTKTFALECRVADGEHFIDHEDFRIKVRGNGERQTYIHPAAVPFHGGVEKSCDLGEFHNLVEPSQDFLTTHAENSAIEKNILTAGEFRMEAGANFEQAGEPAVQPDLTFGGPGDA